MDSYILQINQYRIQTGELFLRGTALCVGCPEETDYRQTSRCVTVISNAVLIQSAIDAVLRAKQIDELESGHCGNCIGVKYVDRSTVMIVHAGLVGHQRDAKVASMFGGKRLQRREVVSLQDIDSIQDGGLRRSLRRSAETKQHHSSAKPFTP
jgi:hypothetical protein